MSFLVNNQPSSRKVSLGEQSRFRMKIAMWNKIFKFDESSLNSRSSSSHPSATETQQTTMTISDYSGYQSSAIPGSY